MSAEELPARPPRRRGLVVALALGLLAVVGGGGLTAYGLSSLSGAEDALAADRDTREETRDDLAASRQRLSVARDALAEARAGAQETRRLGRTTLLVVERLVENDAGLLELARDMRSAALEGQISDFNALVGDINERARQSNRLLRELRRSVAAFA